MCKLACVPPAADVAKDATASPKHPEWGYCYEAALINYAFLAHAVLTTDQAVKAMEHGQL